MMAEKIAGFSCFPDEKPRVCVVSRVRRRQSPMLSVFFSFPPPPSVSFLPKVLSLSSSFSTHCLTVTAFLGTKGRPSSLPPFLFLFVFFISSP